VVEIAGILFFFVAVVFGLVALWQLYDKSGKFYKAVSAQGPSKIKSTKRSIIFIVAIFCFMLVSNLVNYFNQ